MPQMSPMMWLYLFIYFFSIYLIMMIMIHNLYIYNVMKFFKKYEIINGCYIEKDNLLMKIYMSFKW